MESLPWSSPPRSAGGGDPLSGGDYGELPPQWEADPRRARKSAEIDEGASCDGDGIGLMEAFENFNLQGVMWLKAERRVKALLETTDAKSMFRSLSLPEKLFAKESDNADPLDAAPPDTPSYILLSDQYRLSRPPQFHHWRQCFPYLQVTGKSVFDQVPDEHIQIRPGPPLSASSPLWQGDADEMVVVGCAICLEVDTSDPPQEEIILADGEIEEVVEEDRPDPVQSMLKEENTNCVGEDDEDERRPPTGLWACVSPRTSKAEEAVDQLTFEWFAEIVPPLCCTLFETALRKQQLNLRLSREAQEDRTRRAQETLAEAKRQELRRREEEERERIEYEAAVAQAHEEERIREEARHQALVRQQLEENDEEEIKIRTLAYSHLREWYQPKKKCFSHRGRQLTYLKPVLKVRDENDHSDLESVDASARDMSDDATKPQPTLSLSTKPSSYKRPGRARRVSSPSESDIYAARQASPSPERSRLSSEHQIASYDRPRVQLPLIDNPAANRKTKPPAKPSRKRSWKQEQSIPRPSATVAAPSRVYNSSPYRIPPAILKGEFEKDAVSTRRRPN